MMYCVAGGGYCEHYEFIFCVRKSKIIEHTQTHYITVQNMIHQRTVE